VHFIQSKIIDKLLYNEQLRYAQLRPPNIESNHFAYHLKELQKDGLIEKVGRNYTLAPKGLAYVDRLSHKNMKPRTQPKIVTILCVSNERGEQLLFQRNYQPYIHKWGFPSGKTHLEEPVHNAAVRELEEKTGVIGIDLEHRGDVYIEIRHHDFMISKVLGHVFSGNVHSSAKFAETHRGTCVWASLGSFKKEDYIPGVSELHQLVVSSKEFFFQEITKELTD